jgi:pantothenate kinase
LANKIINKTIVLPMDGFHYTKLELKNFEDPAEAFKRRGAHWTFNAEKFCGSIKALKNGNQSTFPSFDHAVGDPVENNIVVNDDIEIILIEGNYLLLDISPWNELKALFDFSYFIDCDLNTSSNRVLNRHISLGLPEEEAKGRVEYNDLPNALEILKSKCFADKIVFSIDIKK